MAIMLTIATALIFCACLRATEASDTGYAERAIEDCTQQLWDLADCLRGDLHILAKINQCNRSMASVFVCLSSYPDDADTHAQEETVVKRGIGRCINRCLQGHGRMNFIQCKSMCHK